MMELQIDEYDIGKVQPGQKVFVGMDSYKGQGFEGVVTTIDPIMNDRSRSFNVDVFFKFRPSNLS